MSAQNQTEKEKTHHEHTAVAETKVYENRHELIEFLAEYYTPGKLEVYRSPGTFVHEYLVGKMTLEQLVSSIRDKMKKGLRCICCMDERVEVETVENGLVISSHEGCGAAGIAAHMVTTDKNYAERYAAVVDAFFPGKTAELLAEYAKAEAAFNHDALAVLKDDFGFYWSAALAQHVGKDFDEVVEHKHLKVHAHEHYSNVTVLSAAEGLQVDISGPVGVRTYSVDSSDRMVDEHAKEVAYDSMAAYGMLSVNIARGGHSSLSQEAPFMIAVVRDESFDEELWKKTWTNLGGLVENDVYTMPTDELVNVQFIWTKELAEAKNKTR